MKTKILVGVAAMILGAGLGTARAGHVDFRFGLPLPPLPFLSLPRVVFEPRVVCPPAVVVRPSVGFCPPPVVFGRPYVHHPVYVHHGSRGWGHGRRCD